VRCTSLWPFLAALLADFDGVFGAGVLDDAAFLAIVKAETFA
jgi:hypothetical protein